MAERKYGKFRAKCMDVHDPEIMGRIRVYCPSVYGQLWSDWAAPSFAPGTFTLPAEGDLVWVEFEEGDTDFPIWSGVWFNRDALPPKQELSDPHSGRTGNVDKDILEHAEDPIDKVEREPFRQGKAYDATRSVIYSDEQGMEIYTDQWTDGRGGLYFRDRAGNELSIKDDKLDTFTYSDMSGNLIKINDGQISLTSGLGASINIEGSTIRFKAEKMVYEVPIEGMGLEVGVSEDGGTGEEIGHGENVTDGRGGNFGAPFRLTSPPGPRESPGEGVGSTMHKGWDWAAPLGTPIPSQSSGKVIQAGYHSIRGYYVRIRDGSTDYIYQHNTRNAVKVGQFVAEGQTLGYVGSTGSSTGPHLHYEVINNGLPPKAEPEEEPVEGGAPPPPEEETPVPETDEVPNVAPTGLYKVVPAPPVPYAPNTRIFKQMPFTWREQECLSDESVKHGDGPGVIPGVVGETPPPAETPIGELPAGTYNPFQATAYDPALGGINSNGDPTTTATSTRPTAGRTIAVDPRVIPYGSVVAIRVPGMPSLDGLYLAEDTGGAIKGNRVDILLSGYSRAMQFGRRGVEIAVLERGTGAPDARAKAKNWRVYETKWRGSV